MNCYYITILILFQYDYMYLYKFIYIFDFPTELTFLFEWFTGVNIKFYGTEEDYSWLGYENALIIPNHRSDVDWLVGWSLSDRVGTLGVRKSQ